MIADDAALGRLMAAAQRGDGAAYTAVLTAAARWLARFFARKVPPGEVDDLVQDVLLSLHAKRASYDPVRPFLPWLAAIARYRWVDHLRRVYRREEQSLDQHDAAVDSEEEAVIARLSIDRLVARIPPRHAQAIALVKIGGLSIAEAAGRSGQSEAAIKVHIHRGLKQLSALIEEAD